ncbi:MAG: chloride channel protein [Ilumatobacteraceae bacterium]
MLHVVRGHVVRNCVLALLGGLSGVAAGVAAFVFLELLDRVTDARLDHPWLVWFLPVGGLVIGFTYHRIGGRAREGTALAVSEARAYTEGAPARMAPMVLGGTLLGHLVGASVGREGTAVQMSSSLTDAGARLLRLDHLHRAALARAALAGGFGAVFGVPFAGVVFAIEVARRRTVRALTASVAAAFAGNWVVGALGHHHSARPHISVPFGPTTFFRLLAAGLVFGLVARVFAVVVPALKRASQHEVLWPPLRPVIGGIATLALMGLFGREYLGLSLPLADLAFTGAHVDWQVPILKLLFTAVALGSGFVGGEVTPLFVVGATAGSVIAGPLGLPPVALAAIGLAAVFGAAAHVPVAVTVMAVELFGWHALVPALLVCVMARTVAHRESIYAHPALTALSSDEGPGPAARGVRAPGPRST